MKFTFNRFTFIIIAINLIVIVTILSTYRPDRIKNTISLYESYYLIEGDQACDIYNKQTEVFKVDIDGVTYPQFTPLYNNKSINFECLQKNNKRNRILLWNQYWSTWDYFYGLGNKTPFIDNQCPVTNCEITNDKNLFNESDFVVIHMLEKKEAIPKRAHPGQLYIMYENESPLESISFKDYNNTFNFSSTYRRDSMTTSIYYAETTINWRLNENFDENQNFLEGKDRMVGTVISNCKDRSNRLGYIKEIQKYISVTIYGKCGLYCPFVECHRFIATKYKFFIAFENSFCMDYITEKFFNILQYNVIPVVMGAGPYDRFVPKSGYINAIDYETPEKLANYLTYLSNNPVAYNSFFKWKKYVVFERYKPFFGHICEWCILLNLNHYEKINDTPFIENMDKFWNPSLDCRWSSGDSRVFNFLNMTEVEGRKKQKSKI